MNCILRMEIPEELKIQFAEDRGILKEKLLSGDSVAKDICVALNENNFLEVLKQVENATTYSRYGYVEKKGFYEEYPLWVEFALMKIMSKHNIDVSDKYKKQDMYTSLSTTQEILLLLDENKEDDDDYSRDFLISQVVYFVHKGKDGAHYNEQVEDMCKLFVDTALSNNSILDGVDISYKSFCQETKGNSYSKK